MFVELVKVIINIRLYQNLNRYNKNTGFMSELTTIPKDASLDLYVDISRYKNQQPGIINMYYKANLLQFIDRLPEQIKRQPQPQVLIVNLNQPIGVQFQKTQVGNLNSSGQIALINTVKAFKHECDSLGNDTIVNNYQISKTMLGRGSHSFVKLAKKQGKPYAIKIIAYDRLKKRIIIKDQHITKMINSEINLLMKLKSQNIIGFEEAIYLQSKQRVFIVLQYCSKGSIQKFISPNTDKNFDQWQSYVKKYMLQIAKGLQKMHQNNIIHRDMKAENVLINEKDEVKIIDFNVSSQVAPNALITITDKFVGTKTYAPPQLVIVNSKSRQVDGRLIDVWALGITYLELLMRSHPFNVSTPAQLIKKLQNPVEISPNVHPDLQDLLKKMLRFQNKQRIQVSEILKHPWFNK